MSEITIDQNIDNIQTKLNNLTEGGGGGGVSDGGSGGGSGGLNTGTSLSLTENNNNEKPKTTLLNSLISFPNIVALILPVLLIILLMVLKPGFVMYTPDGNKPENKKLSIQKCLLFGGVTGVVLGGALLFYLTNMKTEKD